MDLSSTSTRINDIEDIALTSGINTSPSGVDDIEVALERELLTLLNERQLGVSNEELAKMHTIADGRLIDVKTRGNVVNRLLASNKAEMLMVQGSSGFMLRLKRGNQITNATPEEQLVYSLIEESDKVGVWIRDIRERSGLNEAQLKKVLRTLEQRRLVKAVRAVGTSRKCYMLFNLEADETLTGGTFYSDQQLDSQFVTTLAQVCVNMLMTQRRQAEERFPDDVLAQREASYVKSENVARYIHETRICKIPLSITDVESILDVAVLDGKLERRLDHAYRALRVRQMTTALASMPCLQCPVQSECKPGWLISPENCEYFKRHFNL